MKLETERTPEDEAKLALLRVLAKEAIDQLNRGEGIVLNGPDELAEFLRSLGE